MKFIEKLDYSLFSVPKLLSSNAIYLCLFSLWNIIFVFLALLVLSYNGRGLGGPLDFRHRNLLASRSVRKQNGTRPYEFVLAIVLPLL